VASDIAGYRDVVKHGGDGLLVPPGDAVALGEALHDLALDAPRLERLSVRAGHSAEEYAWPRVAAQVMEAYEDAIAVPAPAGATARAAVKLGFRSAAGGPRRPARRLPPLDPRPTAMARAGRLARRAAPLVGVAAAAGGALLALQHIGWDAVAQSVIASSPAWAILAVALMVASMVLRAVSWHAILKAALPASRPRFVDALQGTSIGVLMSATLPARLGEPSRALIVARRLGRPRELLPAVLGTLISQTMLNLVALAVLGTVMFQTVGLFAGRQSALVWYAVAPFAVLCCVLVAPALIRSGRTSRSQRVQGWVSSARSALTQVRSGLTVFRRPKLGVAATVTQLLAWVVQWLACFVLLEGLGLDDQGAGIGAAAAVLFAVNVTAVPAAHAVEPRRLPGCLRGGADERLPRERRPRPRLRDHPPGGRVRHRDRHGRARAGEGGRLLARGAPARAALHARVAGRPAAGALAHRYLSRRQPGAPALRWLSSGALGCPNVVRRDRRPRRHRRLHHLPRPADRPLPGPDPRAHASASRCCRRASSPSCSWTSAPRVSGSSRRTSTPTRTATRRCGRSWVCSRC
jgi:uncharacterized membrane protein YbhN (UPF0104 family)